MGPKNKLEATPTTLYALFKESVAKHGQLPYLRYKEKDVWHTRTYREVEALVNVAVLSLRCMGVKHGDRVAIISGNRWEWVILELATFSLGAVFVPMYESQRLEDWTHVINDCSPRVIFAATQDIAAQVGASGAGAPHTRYIQTLDSRHWLERGTLMTPTEPAPPLPKPEDLCCIIYTSGTTGRPKGVMLSHWNIASNVLGVADLGLAGPGDRSVMILPLAHAFAHTADLHVMTHRGCCITICPGVAEVLPTLADAKPTVCCMVPKLLDRVYDATRTQLAAKPPLIRKLYDAAIAASNRKRDTGSSGLLGWLLWALASLLIFSKVRKKFGGRLQHVICGGAALKPAVAEFMEAVGIPVYIGYGKTECSPVATVVRPGDRRVIGSSGKSIPGVEISLYTAVGEYGTNTGEILVRGPNVMMGYYNNPEATAAEIMPDGALRTGDLGVWDGHGGLRVLDRLNEPFKMANGDWITPSALEGKILTSPLISNVMVYGINKPYLTALVVPANGATEQELLAEAQKLTADCKHHERIRKIIVLCEDFSQENGLLTPTMKVKRYAVAEKYKQEIEQAYA